MCKILYNTLLCYCSQKPKKSGCPVWFFEQKFNYVRKTKDCNSVFTKTVQSNKKSWMDSVYECLRKLSYVVSTVFNCSFLDNTHLVDSCHSWHSYLLNSFWFTFTNTNCQLLDDSNGKRRALSKREHWIDLSFFGDND